MPLYHFITQDRGQHAVDLELIDDEAARSEARKAFAEAAHDALADLDECEMTMTVESSGRVIYRARFAFNAGHNG